MWRLAGLGRLVGARREVALEDALDLVGGDAGTFVVDLQFDRLVVLRQGDDDGGTARREADGVLEDVLQHRLEHALGRAYDHGVVEPADQPDVAAGHDLAHREADQ
jgi:hypothetical protein